MKKKAASGKDVVATTVEALEAPPMCDGFERLTEARALLGANVHGALGWVDEKLIREHGHRPGPRTRVFVCGLPGVYVNEDAAAAAAAAAATATTADGRYCYYYY